MVVNTLAVRRGVAAQWGVGATASMAAIYAHQTGCDVPRYLTELHAQAPVHARLQLAIVPLRTLLCRE
eukprot:244892-Prymnesium_polylepis.1